MTNEIEIKNNAYRLVYTLIRHNEGTTLKKLAYILDYYPSQLEEDIVDLEKYIKQVEQFNSEYDNLR